MSQELKNTSKKSFKYMSNELKIDQPVMIIASHDFALDCDACLIN